MKSKFYLYLLTFATAAGSLMFFSNIGFEKRRHSRLYVINNPPATTPGVVPGFKNSASPKIKKVAANAANADVLMIELNKRQLGGNNGNVSGSRSAGANAGYGNPESGWYAQRNANGGAGGSGSGTAFFGASSGRRSVSPNVAGASMGGGLIADNSAKSTPSGPYKASNGDDDIIVDTGGDPAGPPIPAGNGIYFMALLALGYLTLIRYRRSKTAGRNSQ